MARTRLVISGEPGVPSRVVPMTAQEEAEFDIHDAVGNKNAAFVKEGLTRITALVPSWTSYNQVALNEQLGLLDTVAKRRAARIAKWAFQTKRRLRKLPSVAAINAIDPTSADPFNDTNGWPLS